MAGKPGFDNGPRMLKTVRNPSSLRIAPTYFIDVWYFCAKKKHMPTETKKAKKTTQKTGTAKKAAPDKRAAVKAAEKGESKTTAAKKKAAPKAAATGAAKKLIIVESPAKARTISRYLGKGYKVEASQGHVCDLPRSQMGVDPENDFEMKYITIRGWGDVLSAIRKEAKGAREILFATDPALYFFADNSAHLL